MAAPNHPFQGIAAGLLDPQLAIQETAAIQKHFQQKARSRAFAAQEHGHWGGCRTRWHTFYVWANLSRLPKPLNDGMSFFREGLKESVIIEVAWSLFRCESREPSGPWPLRKLLPHQLRPGNEQT